MRFEAIVHAPVLRVGARLNIAEADQTEGVRPRRLGIGDEVRLRVGCCSPQVSGGRIIGYVAEPEQALLVVGADVWTLLLCEKAGVSVPGLVSEAWFVTAKGDLTASPSDHSMGHSTGVGAAEG